MTGRPGEGETGREGEGETGRPGEEKDARFVKACFEVVLTREASAAEVEVCLEALHGQRSLLANSKDADVETRARASLVRALLNHNDFVTIR